MQQPGGHLRKRIIYLVAHTRLIVTRQTPVAHVANNTYNLDGSGAPWTDRNPDMLANYILTAESVPGKVFVDDYYQFIALPIVLIEEAAFEHRDAHNFEVVGRYAGGERDRLLVGMRRIGTGPVRQGVFPFPHGDDVCEGDEFHFGQMPRAIEYVPPG